MFINFNILFIYIGYQKIKKVISMQLIFDCVSFHNHTWNLLTTTKEQGLINTSEMLSSYYHCMHAIATTNCDSTETSDQAIMPK